VSCQVILQFEASVVIYSILYNICWWLGNKCIWYELV